MKVYTSLFAAVATSCIIAIAFSHPHPLGRATPFYRYWKSSISDHFYTTNINEIGTSTPGQVGHHGYTSEGVQGIVYSISVPGTVPLYRYWKSAVGDHFYTTNANEIGTTTPGSVGNHGYTSEGVAGYCYPYAVAGTVPLYRYWKADVSDHFYTTSSGEIGRTIPGQVGNHGYTSEGIVCYVIATATYSALYRYWKSSISDHFYTTNINEIGTSTSGQVGHHGYTSEGVQGIVFSIYVPGTVPLYRYWKSAVGDHFYTINANEIGTTTPGVVGNHGYTSEGITGYCYPYAVAGAVPLYRYWKADVSDHFYTTSFGEIGTIIPGQVGNHGYTSEGIVCYVIAD